MPVVLPACRALLRTALFAGCVGALGPARAAEATATPSAPSPASSSAPLAVPDTLAQRAMACTACHGREGRATRSGYFPRIAGKPAGYLFNQLVNFRDGRRQYPAMQRLVQHLSDDYLRELADYFAGLDLPYAPVPAGAPAPARGGQLVQHGDAARQVSACVACHGSALTGRLPAVPGLLGLPADYLVAQMGGWQTGQRHAAAPDCMKEVMRPLSPAELADIAQWLAAQPVPANAHARAPAPGEKLPQACGSVQP